MWLVYVLGGNLKGILVVQAGLLLLNLCKFGLHKNIVGGGSTLLLGGCRILVNDDG
jgi:hypothetical protein